MTVSSMANPAAAAAGRTRQQPAAAATAAARRGGPGRLTVLRASRVYPCNSAQPEVIRAIHAEGSLYFLHGVRGLQLERCNDLACGSLLHLTLGYHVLSSKACGSSR